MLLKMSISFVEILYSAHRIGLSKYFIHGAHAAERGKKGMVSLFFINVLSHFLQKCCIWYVNIIDIGKYDSKAQLWQGFHEAYDSYGFLKEDPTVLLMIVEKS